MTVAFVVFFSCVSRANARLKAETEAAETTPTSYANKSIGLNNLSQYPWGDHLHDTLLSIGASDIKAIECEVDSVDVTFKITTETKKLWVSVGGKYDDEWYVEWIRNYDKSEIYYYVADHEERLYSYKTDEIIYEPDPGSSFGYPFVVTVDEFACEIKADVNAAKDKYDGKWIKITGKVTDYSRYSSSSLNGYYLQGKYDKEGLKIVCWQNGEADLQFTKVGCMCTCVGRVSEISTINTTEIVDCQIDFE